MRRATRVIAAIAVLGLFSFLAATPAFADDPQGRPDAGVSRASDRGPDGQNGKQSDRATERPERNGGGDKADRRAGERSSGSRGGTGDAGPSSSGAGASNATTGGGGAGGGAGGKPDPDMTGKSSGPAQHSPPGNNGTIKVHDQGPNVHADVEVRRNQPHVSCTFHLYGFHFDAGQSGSWEIQSWPPNADRGTVVASGSWHASAEGDWQSGAITLPRDGHYKLFFGTFGGHNKHKVFWVEGCVQPTQQPSPTPTATASPTATPTPTPTRTPNGPNKVLVCIRHGNGDFEIKERNANAPAHPNEVPMAQCDDDETVVTGGDKVWVCHITGSGWVKIHIARAGWTNGHSKHEGDVMAETEAGLPQDCGVTGGAVNTPTPTPTPTPGATATPSPTGNGAGTSTIVRDVVCVNNMLMERTFVNGQFVAMTSLGATCVLGLQVPPAPVAAITPLIEQLPQAVQGVLTPAAAQVLSMLPSTATESDRAQLGIAGLALIAAGVLLIRRRVRRTH